MSNSLLNYKKEPLFKQKIRRMWRDRMFYFLIMPGILYFIIFHYIPMYGMQIAFRDYKIKLGFFGSRWVGLTNFEKLLRDPDFIRALVNTIVISLLKISICFPAPIILALMLNALKSTIGRRVIQSISYLPHFLSWIVITAIFRSLLSPTSGVVNIVLKKIGIEPIYFMGDPKYFRWVIVFSDMWKTIGWNSIVFLAALMGVDAQLYEAATVDGASKFRQLISITLPSIAPTIITMFILRVGNILSAGQDQIYAMYSELVYSVSDILDTYALRIGLNNMKYSISTAMSFFKSGIGLIMILITNRLCKLIDENSGIW